MTPFYTSRKFTGDRALEIMFGGEMPVDVVAGSSRGVDDMVDNLSELHLSGTTTADCIFPKLLRTLILE